MPTKARVGLAVIEDWPGATSTRASCPRRNLCSVGVWRPDCRGSGRASPGHPSDEAHDHVRSGAPLPQASSPSLPPTPSRRLLNVGDAEPVGAIASAPPRCAPGAAWRIGRPQGRPHRAPPRARARCPGGPPHGVQIVAEEFDRDLPDHAGDVLFDVVLDRLREVELDPECPQLAFAHRLYEAVARHASASSPPGASGRRSTRGCSASTSRSRSSGPPSWLSTLRTSGNERKTC